MDKHLSSEIIAIDDDSSPESVTLQERSENKESLDLEKTTYFSTSSAEFTENISLLQSIKHLSNLCPQLRQSHNKVCFDCWAVVPLNHVLTHKTTLPFAEMKDPKLSDYVNMAQRNQRYKKGKVKLIDIPR